MEAGGGEWGVKSVLMMTRLGFDIPWKKWLAWTQWTNGNKPLKAQKQILRSRRKTPWKSGRDEEKGGEVRPVGTGRGGSGTAMESRRLNARRRVASR